MKYYLMCDVCSKNGPQQIAVALEDIAKQLRYDVSWSKGNGDGTEYWFELKTIPRTPSMDRAPTK